MPVSAKRYIEEVVPDATPVIKRSKRDSSLLGRLLRTFSSQEVEPKTENRLCTVPQIIPPSLEDDTVLPEPKKYTSQLELIQDYYNAMDQSSVKINGFNHLPSEESEGFVLEPRIDINESQYEDGKLIRPQYINIDPQERYYLLQLKENMKLYNYAQASRNTKFNAIVRDKLPREAWSVGCQHNPRMVETSTQTHDAPQKRSFMQSIAKRKRTMRIPEARKKTSGYFCGDFCYDLKKISEEAAKSDNIGKGMDGYLGTLSTAKVVQSSRNEFDLFDPKRKQQVYDEAVRVQQAAKDTARSFSVSVDATAEKPAVTPSAGFSFMSQKSTDKETREGSTGTAEPDVYEKPEKSSLSAKPVDKTEISTGQPSFGSKEAVPAATPTFSFGAKPATDISAPEASTDVSASEAPTPAPAFSFSAKPVTNISASETPKPALAFSFGAKPSTDVSTSETSTPVPAFSFGAKPSTDIATPETSIPAPAFSFGAKPSTDIVASETSAPAPAFSFGAKPSADIVASEASAPAPTFSFGSTKPVVMSATEAASIPTFSLDGVSKKRSAGDEEETETKKPEVSFGSTPISFGAATTPKTDFSFGAATTPKTNFSFGISAKPETSTSTPSLSLGSSDKAKDTGSTVPVFGASGTAPSFSFTGAIPATEKPTTPAFSFGASKPAETEAAKTEVPKMVAPNTAFGTSATPSSDPKLAFSLSEASKPTFGDTSTAPATTENKLFSFGAPPVPGSTPSTAPVAGFSFGATAAPTTPGAQNASESLFGTATKTAFTFGDANKPMAAAPAPAFGFSTTPSASSSVVPSKEATPVFAQAPSAFSFGTASQPAVNAPAAASVFRFGATTAPTFGSNNSSTTNIAGGFGNPPTQGPDSNTASAFGTNPSSTFGASAPVFGANPPSAFGTSAPVFGASNGSGFNFSASSPVTPQPQTGFNPANPSFNFGGSAAPTDPAAVFGQPSAAFGGNNGMFGQPNAPSMGTPSPSGTPQPSGAPRRRIIMPRSRRPGPPGR